MTDPFMTDPFMSDPIRHLRSITEELNRSFSFYESMTSQILKSASMSRTLQESLVAQRAIDRSLIASTVSALDTFRLPDLTSNYGDLLSANKVLSQYVSQASNAESTLSKVIAEHNSLRNSIESITSLPTARDLLSSLDTTRLLNTSLTSQYRLLDLEKQKFGSMIGASTVWANDLAATFGKFTSSYRDVVDAIPVVTQNIGPLIATYAPIEYSLELDVIEQITIEPEDETYYESLPSLDEELATFDNRLLTMLNGARDSLNSSNPDKARHVTTSVRELFTHIIHRLAPDDDIKKWSTNETHYHENRPTRRARLLYICRKFSCDPLTKFIEDDVRAALSLVDSLNAGTHVVQSKLTQSQLQAIVYRMESLVLFLLKVSRGQD
jgi:Predicted pPIWI-associating nuclease